MYAIIVIGTSHIPYVIAFTHRYTMFYMRSAGNTRPPIDINSQFFKISNFSKNKTETRQWNTSLSNTKKLSYTLKTINIIKLKTIS